MDKVLVLKTILIQVMEIPTRPGNIAGKDYSYVRLEEVLDILRAEIIEAQKEVK